MCSLPKTLPCFQTPFNTRTSGHWLGTLKPVHFLFPSAIIIYVTRICSDAWRYRSGTYKCISTAHPNSYVLGHDKDLKICAEGYPISELAKPLIKAQLFSTFASGFMNTYRTIGDRDSGARQNVIMTNVKRGGIVKERTVVYLSSLGSPSETGNGQENDSNSVAHEHTTHDIQVSVPSWLRTKTGQSET